MCEKRQFSVLPVFLRFRKEEENPFPLSPLLLAPSRNNLALALSGESPLFVSDCACEFFHSPKPSLSPHFRKEKVFPPVPFFHALKVQKVFLPFWRKENILLVLIPWKWAFRAFSLLLRFSRCYVRYFVWKWTFLLLSSLIVLDIIIIIGLGGLTLLLSHHYCRHAIATDCLEMFRSGLNYRKLLQNPSLDSIPPRQLERSGANELGDQDGTRRDREEKSKHTKKRRRRHHSLFPHLKLGKKKKRLRRRQGRTVVFL